MVLMRRLCLLFFCLLAMSSRAMAVYCGRQNCYALLGVKQSATAAEIKKSYYKLSMKYHPDKNPDPDAQKTFAQIANAYEILKNNDTREQYDYALAHPEQFLYNYYNYYGARLGLRPDLRLVIMGPLLFISALQWLNSKMRYEQVVAQVKQTPAYRNKLRALELERDRAAKEAAERGGARRRAKASGKGGSAKGASDTPGDSSEPDAPKSSRWNDYYQYLVARFEGREDDKPASGEDALLELDIQGAEKPNLWGLLITRILILPYTLSKWLLWNGRWFLFYTVQRNPYHFEDAAYLTCNALNISQAVWDGMSEKRQDDLVLKRLWVGKNLAAFQEQAKKDYRKRR